jgi:hypothetical protein
MCAAKQFKRACGQLVLLLPGASVLPLLLGRRLVGPSTSKEVVAVLEARKCCSIEELPDSPNKYLAAATSWCTAPVLGVSPAVDIASSHSPSTDTPFVTGQHSWCCRRPLLLLLLASGKRYCIAVFNYVFSDDHGFSRKIVKKSKKK